MSTTNTEYEMESPYLEAIQKIPGKTPGEKYQTLNCIARNLIDDAMDIDDNDVKNVDVKSSAELPECLVPIVQLEVAKIIHQADGIVAALKSDDAFINERALKVKWFFDGSNESITTSQYFNEHIFPHVSLTVRIKIIKNLAKYLMLSNKQSIAENFYIELKEQYGEELVRPLCFACGEDFIRITTSEWKKPVTVSELEIIYPRFPNLVFPLLRMFTVLYSKFLPKLLKNHADIFADIVKQNNLVIKLSSKKCQLFLKNARNAFLDNPIIFMPSLSLKLITSMLNKLEFHQFFKKMFPQNYKKFCFTTFYECLKYYSKKKEKMNLIMSTFEDVYGISLLECSHLISFPLLIEKHPDVFVDILKELNLAMKLNDEKSSSFLENVRDHFLKDPVFFISILPLESIIKKLNKSEFHEFYKHLFPENYKDFSFTTFYQLLEYYPKEEKLNLLTSTFEDLYGISPLECVDSISFSLLLENHANVFVDIVKMFNLENNISNKKCESFLEKVLDHFSQPNKGCMPLQSLKLITELLNELEFRQFYKHLFPQNHKKLYLTIIYKYLEYYPEEKKINLLISTFEDIYKINFFEWINSMSIQWLLRSSADIFVDIVKEFTSNVKLRCEKSESFFKRVRRELLNNPELFMSLLPTESITKKLNKLEFHQFYLHLFPENYKDFSFTTFYKLLEYFPEEERINLLVSTFEDLYGISMLECDYLIPRHMIELLNPEQRITIAKKKMKINDKTVIKYIQHWVCYLPTNESIPLIKEKISKESELNNRCEHLKELIYTCKVNKDYDALLNVLEYIFMRHKNEQYPVIPNVLKKLRADFDVKNLPKEHIIIVDQFVMFLHAKNELKSCLDVSSNLICDLIFSKIKHNEEFNKYIELYIEFDRKNILNHYDWNILKAYPSYERRYLIEFIKHVCIHENLLLFVNSILRSMYDFNRRNAETEVPLENLSIKHFPLLEKDVENIVRRNLKADDQYSDSVWHDDWYRKTTRILLLEGEKDIFSSFVDTSNLPEESSSEKIEFHDSSVIKLLQKSPEKIVENWNEYLELCKNNITRRNLARRFLRYTRWHQDLPIMFASQCLKELEVKENDDNHKNLHILAVLYEGASYEKFITPFIPKSETLDLTNSTIRHEYTFNCSILRSLNIVNPPVSFSPFFKYCQGAYVHDAVNTLYNVGRRVPVDKVIEFSKTLVDQKISVKKHGIRLFCQVASHDQIHEMMLHLWKKEKHPSARQVVYQCIFELFIDAPSSQSWSIIQTCMDEVKTEDYFWESIFDISEIPDDFYERYILKLFKTIKRIEEIEEDFGRSDSQACVVRILNKLSYNSHLLSEEFHQYIIKNYFTDFSRPEYVWSNSIWDYIIKIYIAEAGDKLDSRLVYLNDVILKIVETWWNIPSTYNSNVLTGNYFIHKLIACICEMNCDHIKIQTAKSLLDALLTVLKPEQLGTSYLDLVYIGILDNEYTFDQMIHQLVQLIPSLIEIYSSKLMSTIVQHFKKPLNMFLKKKENTSIIVVIEKLIASNDKNILLFTSILFCESITSDEKDRHRINIDKLRISSEKLHQYIIKNVLTDFSRPEYSLSDSFQNYIIEKYIDGAGDKLESRLVFLTDVIFNMVKSSWEIPCIIENCIAKTDDVLESKLVFLPDNLSKMSTSSWKIASTYNVFTVNHFIHKLIVYICKMRCDHIKIRTAKVLLDALLKVLKPEHLGNSYLDLVYVGVFNNDYTVDQMIHKLVQLIPSLVEVYSSELVSTIVQHIKKPLHMFLDKKENIGITDIIEKLIVSDDENVILFTSTLLLQSIASTEERQYSINIDKIKINSEELHQYIISHYLASLSRPDYLLSVSFQKYIIEKYIFEAGDKLESRLIFLNDVIFKMVKTSWHIIPSERDTKVHRVHSWIYQLIACICNMNCNHIKIRMAEVVLDALLKVLKPEQLGTPYLDLVYVGVFNNESSIDQIAHKLEQLLPSLIEIYSSESVSTIIQHLKKPLHIFFDKNKHLNVIDIIEKLILSDDKNVLLFTNTLLSESTALNKEECSIIIDKSRIKLEELHYYIIKNYFTNLLKPEYFQSNSVWNYIVNIYITKADDKLESRLVFLTDIISEMIKTSWKISSTYNSTNVLTVNHFIHKLIGYICKMRCDHIKIQTAKVLLDALLKVLKPKQLGTFYLDLVYIGVFDNEYTIDQMIHQLVQLIPSLVVIYSSNLMSTIVQHFKKPLHMFLDKKENIGIIDIIEKLIASDDENVLLFTSTLLFESNLHEGKRYSIVMNKLIMSKYPSIAIPIIDKLNSQSLNINAIDLLKQ